ncbi:MAG: SRPBCC family protein [Chloroflexi bacterium]|nr:SRPBCC family protein [Chloroflexota bacterium]
MTSPLEAHHISISINRPFAAVNDFLSVPQNFEQWAAGLGSSFRQQNGEWLFGDADNPARIRFTPKNPFGVADHTVYPPDGSEVYVPMRAVANGSGSEVIFTLYRPPEMTDQQFAADSAAVRRDLEKLKALLEA